MGALVRQQEERIRSADQLVNDRDRARRRFGPSIPVGVELCLDRDAAVGGRCGSAAYRPGMGANVIVRCPVVGCATRMASVWGWVRIATRELGTSGKRSCERSTRIIPAQRNALREQQLITGQQFVLQQRKERARICPVGT